MHVDLVICGEQTAPQDSAELAAGHARLLRQWPHTDWINVPPCGPEGLVTAALQHGAHFADDALVLLLAHGQWLAPDAVPGRLMAAVSVENPVALCWGGSQQPEGMPPEYYTLRGLERYCDTTARAAAGTRHTTLSALPVAPMAVARMSGLRALANGSRVEGTWVGGCHAHDYGTYHQAERHDVLDLVPPGARRVLDVGGGEGLFLQALRTQRGCETHLSEYSTHVCARAAARVDMCWPGDFLAQRWKTLPDGGAGAFDCITLLDSLEHTPQPELWLDRIHTLLAPDGCLIGSVPNVGHWSVVADLLEGRWDYGPTGIHCITHLRFFTRRTLVDLLEQQGFALDVMRAVSLPCPPDWAARWHATPGLQVDGGELDTYAFLFRARRAARTVSA